MNGQELIIIDQLPVIRERLATVKAEIESRVRRAMDAPCTEETYTKVKKDRAELNKTYQELEERRKEVKRQVMAPYAQFEEAYNEYIRDVFTPGLKALDERIATVTNAIIIEKRARVERYFKEYCESVGIYFLTFSDSGVKVNQSTSEKRLKEAAKAFVDKVLEDIQALSALDCAAEALAEYKTEGPGYLNASAAIATVKERQSRIAAEQTAAENAAPETADQAEPTPEDAGLSAPVELPEEPPEIAAADVDAIEPVLRVSFTVYGTRTELKALKRFLMEGGYQYE